MNETLRPGIVFAIARVVAVLLLACASSTCSGDAAEATDADAEVAGTIRQLGAANFVARENAAQRLLQLGQPAEAALVDASHSGDREIRDRSVRILALIRQRRRTEEIAAFRRNDKPPRYRQQDSLPGWREFSKRFDDSSVARNTFARMFEAEWKLLTDFFSDTASDQRRTLTSNRHRRLQQAGVRYQNYSVGTMLSLFFLATEDPDGFELHMHLYSLVRHRELQPLLRGTSRSDAAERRFVRKMVGAWLVAASGRNSSDRIALQTARVYQMHDAGSIIAKRVLTNDEALPLSKSIAMEAITLRGDKSQIALIEPYLEDRTILGETGNRVRQLGDVALACLMQLNGHDVTKIGIKRTNTTHSAFSRNSLGFMNESDRLKARETYRELQAAKK